jgi:hypothetical protein
MEEKPILTIWDFADFSKYPNCQISILDIWQFGGHFGFLR